MFEWNYNQSHRHFSIFICPKNKNKNSYLHNKGKKVGVTQSHENTTVNFFLQDMFHTLHNSSIQSVKFGVKDVYFAVV